MSYRGPIYRLLFPFLLLNGCSLLAASPGDTIFIQGGAWQQWCPIMADAGADFTVCANTVQQLNGSYTGAGGNISYHWTATPSTGNAWLSNANIANPTVNIPWIFSGTMTYTLTVTSTNPNCTATDQIAITVQPSPFVAIYLVVAATCTMGGSLFTTPSNAVPPYSYFWSDISGTNTYTTQDLINVPPAQYFMTVTDALGCSVTSAFPIPGPQPINAMVNNPTICGSGSSATLTVTGMNMTSFAWSTGQSGNPITVNAPGTYTVTVTAANNCTATAESTVSAMPNPVPVLNMPTLCPGGSATLTVSGGPFTQANWSTGQTGDFINITNPGTYTVTITDANGCTGSTSQTVTAFPPPQPGIDAPPSLCVGSMVTLTVNGGSFNPINWSNGMSGSPITVSTPGSYTATVTDANGCTATASKTITAFPVPMPAITGPAGLCAGATGILNVGGGNFSPINWSTGENGPSITVSAPGSYGATVTDANGCTASASQTLAAYPSPLPVLHAPAALCPGGSATLSLSGGSFSSINWSTGESGNSILVNTPGTYGATVSNSNGCTASTAATIAGLPFPTPDIAGPAMLCEGGTGMLTVSGGFYPAIHWSNGQGGSPLFIFAPGNYVATVTDDNGCTNTAGLTIPNGLPLLPQIVGNTSICADGGSTLLSAGSFDFYTWSGGQSTPNITVTTPGDYAVTVTDAAGCTGEDVVTVTAVDCCPTHAGVLDTASLFLCGPKAVSGVYSDSLELLQPGDTLVFILYADSLHPLTSVLAYSDTAYFPFLADTLLFDSTYFIAAIAGPLLANDTIDFSSACLSISTPLKVRWHARPTMTLVPTPQAVCKAGCLEENFQFTGAPPFHFTWKVLQGGVMLLAKAEVVSGFEGTIQVCPGEFVPAVDGPVEFRVMDLEDKKCQCGE